MNPWIKFWTRDLLGDVRLANCSIGAQGLWLRIVCVMSQQPRPGILEDHGVPWDSERILARAGVSEVPGLALLAELESCGQLQRTAEGSLICRRLARDARDRASGVERTKRWRDSKHNSGDGARDGPVTSHPDARYQINSNSKAAPKPAVRPDQPVSGLKTEDQQRRIVYQRDLRIERERQTAVEANAGANPYSTGVPIRVNPKILERERAKNTN